MVLKFTGRFSSIILVILVVFSIAIVAINAGSSLFLLRQLDTQRLVFSKVYALNASFQNLQAEIRALNQIKELANDVNLATSAHSLARIAMFARERLDPLETNLMDLKREARFIPGIYDKIGELMNQWSMKIDRPVRMIEASASSNERDVAMRPTEALAQLQFIGSSLVAEVAANLTQLNYGIGRLYLDIHAFYKNQYTLLNKYFIFLAAVDVVYISWLTFYLLRCKASRHPN